MTTIDEPRTSEPVEPAPVVPPPTGPTPPVGDDDGERDGWLIVAVLVAVVAMLAAVVAAGFAFRADDDEASDSGAAAGGAAQTFQIELGDLYVEPSSIEVEAGSPVVLEVTNAGAVQHDLKLDGETGTDMLDPGASATVELGPLDADAQAWCTVPGHKEAGMVLDIDVNGEAAAPHDGGGSGT